MSRLLSARTAILALSVSVYIFSLISPSVNGQSGIGMLISGPVPNLLSSPDYSWFANPALMFAWVATYFRILWAARLLSLLALIAAASILVTRQVLATDAGSVMAVTEVGAGYYNWIASAALGFLAAMLPAQTKTRAWSR